MTFYFTESSNNCAYEFLKKKNIKYSTNNMTLHIKQIIATIFCLFSTFLIHKIKGSILKFKPTNTKTIEKWPEYVIFSRGNIERKEQYKNILYDRVTSIVIVGDNFDQNYLDFINSINLKRNYNNQPKIKLQFMINDKYADFNKTEIWNFNQTYIDLQVKKWVDFVIKRKIDGVNFDLELSYCRRGRTKNKANTFLDRSIVEITKKIYQKLKAIDSSRYLAGTPDRSYDSYHFTNEASKIFIYILLNQIIGIPINQISKLLYKF